MGLDWHDVERAGMAVKDRIVREMRGKYRTGGKGVARNG
jgi:hypothetical protein